MGHHFYSFWGYGILNRADLCHGFVCDNWFNWHIFTFQGVQEVIDYFWHTFIIVQLNCNRLSPALLTKFFEYIYHRDPRKWLICVNWRQLNIDTNTMTSPKAPVWKNIILLSKRKRWDRVHRKSNRVLSHMRQPVYNCRNTIYNQATDDQTLLPPDYHDLQKI